MLYGEIIVDTINLDLIRGFLYSTNYTNLVQKNVSLNTLKNSVNYTEEGIKISPDNDKSFEVKIEIAEEDLGDTLYVRAYAKFIDGEGKIREYIAQNNANIPLRNGWYQKTSNLDLRHRQGAISIMNEAGTKCIVGTGCHNNNDCFSNVTSSGYPFIRFPEEEKIIDCPEENETEVVYNRHRGVGFWIRDSIYFGFGQINNDATNDFFAYSPDNCYPTITKQPNIDIKPRIDAIGFARKNHGYIGFQIIKYGLRLLY